VNEKKNKFSIGKVRQLLLLALPMVLMSKTLIAQDDEIIKSVYKYSSNSYSLKVPDSIIEKLPVNKDSNNLTLNLGHVYYTNFYSKNFSKTEITFEASPGVQFGDGIKPAFFINDEKNKLYLLFEDSIIIKQTKYFMPVLSKTNVSDTVNGYLSSLYIFKNDNDISFQIWLSNKIPWCVAPGFYFHNYGGITRIEYQYGDFLWSLDLDGYEKTNKNSLQKKSFGDFKNIQTELFPFFTVK
jgi:hypothetical protein